MTYVKVLGNSSGRDAFGDDHHAPFYLESYQHLGDGLVILGADLGKPRILQRKEQQLVPLQQTYIVHYLEDHWVTRFGPGTVGRPQRTIRLKENSVLLAVSDQFILG